MCASIVVWLLLAQAHAPEIARMRHRAGDQQQRLTRTMLEWQKRLGLTHYALALRVVRLEKLNPGEVGSLFLDLDTGVGYIAVLDAGEYLRTSDGRPQKLKAILRDQKDTVVHELVHIMLANPYDSGSQNAMDYNEHVTATLAGSLLKGGR